MITRDMKISKMLEEYPGSLEALIRVSPHFRKLENKILRKALAGRVTVEQAAKVAGVDLEFLLSELNRSAGSVAAVTVEAEETRPVEEASNAAEEKPEFLRSHDPGKVVTLDVRPILDSGKDPLREILSKAMELGKGEILLIINSFEPIPLYSRLKGFLHYAETENDVWKIYFFKESDAVVPEDESPAAASGAINIDDYDNVIEVDVHDLPAPEPMVKILENLSRIDDKSVMLVHHHREPNLLYPRLEERGFVAQCTRLGEESYQILIAKKKKS
ncbi:MAG TPA: DUF2249 domain-containing protein [Ignavibacteriales bacterium]|nr:DUF2249 domain-containing protein [Ignavibacteriales bacterium]